MENSKKLEIYVDIKSEPILVGSLFIDVVKNKETYSFQFADSYLSRNINYVLDPELELVNFRQYKKNPNDLYGFLKDAMPDRWGRKLLNRVYNRKLFESDYLCLITDISREGSIRIKKDDTFLTIGKNQIPNFIYLNKLEQAALNVENDLDAELYLLFEPGSSLGGARPKANVYNNDNELYIAKFPSRNDEYDVEKVECLMLDLAEILGIEISSHKLVNLSQRGSTLLIKRFDRNKEERIPYVSMMTLLNAEDGNSNEYSYLDMLDIVKTYSSTPKDDYFELFKRLIFNILIHNNDDHLRNHGFIYKDNKWRLSPAFDLNPSFYESNLTLSIDGNNYEFDIDTAIKTSTFYGITNNDAIKLVEDFKKKIAINLPILLSKYSFSTKEENKIKTILLAK